MSIDNKELFPQHGPYYWVHHESECVGWCCTLDELELILNDGGLAEPICQADYIRLIDEGYEY